MSTQQALRRVPLLRDLSAQNRERLKRVATVVSFEREERLFLEGDPSSNLLAVTSGRVKVVKSTPQGKDLILGLFGVGDLVGAVVVLRDSTYPASAIALEQTTCLSIPKKDLFVLLESQPSLARELLATLSLRLVALTERLADQRSLVEVRHARFFMQLVACDSRPRDGGIFIPIALSRQELADLMCTTIETSIRIMSRWQKAGTVRTEQEGFFVADAAKLRRLAHG